jgi:DNA-binding beta-propeller fold protein YncE
MKRRYFSIGIAALFAASAATAQAPVRPVGDVLFVANKAEGSVSRIRLIDGREETRDAACKTPHELALSPDGAHLAVGCYDGSTIEILRAADLENVATVTLGDGARPHGVVWHANGDLYASAEGRKSVFRVRNPISDAREITEFSTGKEGSHMIAVSADARHAWTADLGSGTVTRVDLVTRRAPQSVETGKGTEGLALSPDGSALLVSAREEDKLQELDPQTLEVRRTITTGRFPLRAAVHPTGRWVVTSNLRDGSLSVIDAQTGAVARTIRVSGVEGTQQVTLAFDASGDRLYAAETGINKIAEIDFASGMVLGRLSGGAGGDGLAILPQRTGD